MLIDPSERRTGRPTAITTMAILLSAAVIFVACRPEAPPADAPLDTVDVAPPPAIDPEKDPRARPRAPVLRGVLPSGFPRDIPLFLPASIADTGRGGGRQWIELESPKARSEVRRQLESQLRQAGWSGALDARGGTWRIGGRTLEVALSDGVGGTSRYRLTVSE